MDGRGLAGDRDAAGGIYGRQIRVVVKDDGYKPEQTLAMTRELLSQERPIALFGFVGTGNVLALVKNRVLEDADMPGGIGNLSGRPAADLRRHGGLRPDRGHPLHLDLRAESARLQRLGA